MRRRELLGAAAALLAAAGVASAAEVDRVALVARSRGAVFPIGTYSPTDSPRFGFSGTAFAVSDGRLLVTNVHVVQPGQDSGKRMAIRIERAGSREEYRELELVAMDRANDLALLRPVVPGRLPATLELGPDAMAPEGTDVLLLGYPLAGALGFSQIAHRGMIAAITHMALPSPSARGLNAALVRQLRADPIDILQLDATAYPGNSGGPLLDQQTGQVVGVVSMVFAKAGHESVIGQPSGISYAIPAAPLRRLVARVEAESAR